MKFNPGEIIPKRIQMQGIYQINIEWKDIEWMIERYIKKHKLQLNPDFQRGHVWTKAQQIAYIEFILEGGLNGKDIYFNCPGWQADYHGNMVCVDGLQRLTAIRKFINNEIKVYSKYYAKNFTALPTHCQLYFNVHNLETRADVLKWYLEMNSSGTPHAQEELDRVQKLHQKEIKNGQ